MRREKLEQWVNEPFFEDTLPGCMVGGCMLPLLPLLLLVLVRTLRAAGQSAPVVAALRQSVRNADGWPRPASLPPSHPPPPTSCCSLQVRIAQADVQGPDGQSYRRYALCQVVAVETRAPGGYK